MSLACERIGRWLYHFSQIELSLNEGISKLFELDAEAASIITANIDFSRKINIIQTMVAVQSAAKPREWKEEAKKLFSEIKGLNDPDRQIVAHSAFEPGDDDSVHFKRIVAKGKLVNEPPVWTKKKFEDDFVKLAQLTTELRAIVGDIAPYRPSLDFSDPRNSMYLAVM